MEVLISAVILIFVIIWATRVENGINKINDTLQRIEQQSQDKKEKK